MLTMAFNWLPEQEFYPYAEKGLKGAGTAYWGFALFMLSGYIAHTSVSFNVDHGATRGFAIAVTVVFFPVVVWVIASHPRGDSWGIARLGTSSSGLA